MQRMTQARYSCYIWSIFECPYLIILSTWELNKLFTWLCCSFTWKFLLSQQSKTNISIDTWITFTYGLMPKGKKFNVYVNTIRCNGLHTHSSHARFGHVSNVHIWSFCQHENWIIHSRQSAFKWPGSISQATLKKFHMNSYICSIPIRMNVGGENAPILHV